MILESGEGGPGWLTVEGKSAGWLHGGEAYPRHVATNADLNRWRERGQK